MKEKFELWKDIPEYEGLYQVSNLGRVKSLKRKGISKDRILKPTKFNNGYMNIVIYKNNKQKHFLVHRLVAFAFIPNPENLPYVNHKNEIKTDNRVENLEFCTHEYNDNYGTRNERVSEKHKGKTLTEVHKRKISESKEKPILQYTKDMIFVREWDSAKSASIELKINQGNICWCCKGKLKTAKGFIWQYKE